MQGTVKGQTLAGIDVLVKNQFVNLTGRRVGLITNQTGVNAAGESTVTLLADADNVDLVALFSPEHGFAGQLDQSEISDSEDQSTGIKIHSLYGKTRVPTRRWSMELILWFLTYRTSGLAFTLTSPRWVEQCELLPNTA